MLDEVCRFVLPSSIRTSMKPSSFTATCSSSSGREHVRQVLRDGALGRAEAASPRHGPISGGVLDVQVPQIFCFASYNAAL